MRSFAYMFWTPPIGEINSMQELLVWQDGRCAMCGEIKSRLVLDHCHDTGVARGWLCDGCNSNEGKDRSGNYGFHDPAWTTYRAFPPSTIYGQVPTSEGRLRYAIPHQNLTHEQRQEIARWVCEVRVDPRTPEQRSADAKKASAAGQIALAQRTPEQKAAAARKISATRIAHMTPEQRSEAARHATAHLTYEQRLVNSAKAVHRKGSENGNASLAEFEVIGIKTLLSQQVPGRVIGALYSISKTQISRIRRGVHWGELDIITLPIEQCQHGVEDAYLRLRAWEEMSQDEKNELQQQSHHPNAATEASLKRTPEQKKVDNRKAGLSSRKLTEDDVAGILMLLAVPKDGRLSQRKIGALYGVSQAAVSLINLGKDWSAQDANR